MDKKKKITVKTHDGKEKVSFRIHNPTPKDKPKEEWNFMPGGYQSEFESTCPVCGGHTDGEGIFSNGTPIIFFNHPEFPDREYYPEPGEMLRSVWQECDDKEGCEWNEYG